MQRPDPSASGVKYSLEERRFELQFCAHEQDYDRNGHVQNRRQLHLDCIRRRCRESGCNCCCGARHVHGSGRGCQWGGIEPPVKV